jgi:hypothetical protein
VRATAQHPASGDQPPAAHLCLPGFTPVTLGNAILTVTLQAALVKLPLSLASGVSPHQAAQSPVGSLQLSNSDHQRFL